MQKYFLIIIISFLISGCYTRSQDKVCISNSSSERNPYLIKELESKFELAKNILVEDKYLAPMVMLYTLSPKGEWTNYKVEQGEFLTREDKLKFMEKIAVIVKREGFNTVLTISEFWERSYKDLKAGEDIFGDSTLTGKEGFMIIIAHSSGEIYYISQMFHKEGDKIAFDENTGIKDKCGMEFGILEPILKVWGK